MPLARRRDSPPRAVAQEGWSFVAISLPSARGLTVLSLVGAPAKSRPERREAMTSSAACGGVAGVRTRAEAAEFWSAVA